MESGNSTKAVNGTIILPTGPTQNKWLFSIPDHPYLVIYQGWLLELLNILTASFPLHLNNSSLDCVLIISHLTTAIISQRIALLPNLYHIPLSLLFTLLLDNRPKIQIYPFYFIAQHLPVFSYLYRMYSKFFTWQTKFPLSHPFLWSCQFQSPPFDNAHFTFEYKGLLIILTRTQCYLILPCPCMYFFSTWSALTPWHRAGSQATCVSLQ